MSDSRLPTAVYFLLLVFGVWHFAQVYPQLPERMASHFSADGTPNGWSPKQAFFILMAMITAVTAIPAFFVPRMLKNLPRQRINLPNKEYWLAPERRTETIEYLGMQMGWFGCALLALLFCAFYNAVAANLGPNHTFDSGSFYVALGAFFAFLIVWLVRLLSHFARIPQQDARS